MISMGDLGPPELSKDPTSPTALEQDTGTIGRAPEHSLIGGFWALWPEHGGREWTTPH